MTQATATAVAPKKRLTKEELEQFLKDMEAAIAKARPSAKHKLEKARAYIILDHPFFATIMLKRPMIERLDIPTLAVTDRGTIFYNPLFIDGLENQEIIWAICHEVLHYASGHGIRVQKRDRAKWNWAGDAWINDTLDRAKIGKHIPGTVDVPGSADRTVEDIYASIPEDDGDGKGGKGAPQQGPGNGNDPMADDLEHDDDGDGQGAAPPSESERAEIDAQRKMEVAEAAQVAKMKGNLPGVLQKFAAETIESKTPWYDILERYFTERAKVDVSWSKPNRRYAPEFYMPVMDGVGSMGEVVIQVDISGSVSRQEIAHYNGHMKRIVEQCRPNKVHVIYTDTEVQHHDTFDSPEDVEIVFHSGGGTDMRAGFEYIDQKGIEPEVVVTLTDGYTPFPDALDVPSVWCISSDVESPVGTNVHFDMHDGKN